MPGQLLGMSGTSSLALLSSRTFQILIGIAISVASVFYVAQKIDYGEFFSALGTFDFRFLVPAVAALGLGYVVRIYRWMLLLNAANANLTWSTCAPPFMASIALNNILPLRAGDVVRAVVFPRKIGVSRSLSTVSLVFERLFDFSAICIGLLLGLALSPNLAIPDMIVSAAQWLGLASLAGIIFLSAVVPVFRKRFERSNSKFGQVIQSFFNSTALLSNPRVLLISAFLSFPIWLGEAGLFYFVALGFGISITFTNAIFVMALATLATLIPSSPGYIGPFHLAALTAVSLAGLSMEIAAGYATFVHLALWGSTTFVGITILLFNSDLYTFGAAKTETMNDHL